LWLTNLNHDLDRSKVKGINYLGAQQCHSRPRADPSRPRPSPQKAALAKGRGHIRNILVKHMQVLKFLPFSILSGE
jgi:hypothetical protein